MTTSRQIVALITLLLAAGAAAAAPEEDARAQFLRRVVADYYVPRMAAFAASTDVLVKQLDAMCKAPGGDTLAAARGAWTGAMLAWERANAITYGPLQARRSIYRIDFWPVRRNQVSIALREPPTTLEGLELIGGPGKGFPAIEWLLWSSADPAVVAGEASRCGYTLLLARGVQEEARLLVADYARFAPQDPPAENIDAHFSELLNQSLGGLERLTVKDIEKPATLGGGKGFPRLTSGQTLAMWQTVWSSLRAFLVGEGSGPAGSLDGYLRTQDLAAIADKVKAAADRVSRSMQATTAATPAASLQVVDELARLRAVLANDVADALKITVQFEETDGD